MASIHTGAAFWLDGVPPLSGGAAKRRPVIVVDDDQLPPAEPDLVLVVATTTDLGTESSEASGEAIAISGLPERSWAIPRWTFYVHRGWLYDYIDDIPAAELDALIEAVIEAYWDG